MEIELGATISDFFNYDLSLKVQEKNNDDYINGLIKEHLGKFSNKWFAEYSVIATTIDPQRENKLRCFSLIYDKECLDKCNSDFKKRVEKYVSPIISVLKDNHGNDNWWFHNPETFLAPAKIDPYISFSDKSLKVEKELRDKIIEQSDDIINRERTKEDEDGYYQGKNGPIYFSSLEYPRSFRDILNYSRRLYATQKNNDTAQCEDNLIKHYHDGVEEARLYYDEFIIDKEKDETFCYLTFPIIAAHARFITPEIYEKTYGAGFLDNRYQGLGHCFIYFNITNPSGLNHNDFINSIKALFQDINKALVNFAFNYTFNIGLLLQKRSKEEAIKSAKAAIMSRNMSHNLGSHVMAYLKHHLSSVKDMLNDQILSQLFVDEKDLQSLFNDPEAFSKKLLKRIKNCHAKKEDSKVDGDKRGEVQTDSILSQTVSKNEVDVKPSVSSSEGDLISHVALPFLVGLGQFISYLQERQDYIATVATDYVPYYSTVNFKDFIYDELNNDKRYARHPDRQNLKPDNILLGNIARSEGLGRSTSTTSSNEDNSSLHDIVLKFRTTFNGDPVEKIEMPPVNPADYYKDVEVGTAKRELEEMRKYDVSLPGGIVGRQAVFSIIENVVRNAAKHGNWRDVGKLELTIDIFSKDDVIDNVEDEKLEILRKRFFDNDAAGEHSLSLKEVLKKYYCHENTEDNDYFFITLTDNLPFPTLGADAENGIVPSALCSLRKALIEDYVDDNNQIKNSNKGMKEIRISSAWLRSIEDNSNLFVYNEDDCMLEDGLWGEPKTHTPPVVFVRLSKREKEQCHLQFIICLVRPQRVAVISNGCFSELSKGTNMLLHNKFWKSFSPREFIDYDNKSFDIVVYDDFPEKKLEESISSKREKGQPCEEEKTSLAKMASERESIRLKASSRFIRLSELEIDERAAFDQLRNDIHNDTLSEDDITKAEIMLYRHLSGWDGKEMILIDDGRAANHFNEQCKDTSKSQNLSDKIAFGNECLNAKYRYLTHLEDREKFMEHIILDKEDYVKQFVFSEGITGNNSTDRLVRNEELTEIWFYKHLRAMKQKVAIFDERIFSKAFGLEESDFSKDFFDDPKFSKYKNESDERKRQIMKKFGVDSRITDTLTIDTKNHIGITYDFKRVRVFSIIRSNEKKDSFSLYGCRLKKDNLDGFSECIKYATLSWNDAKMELIVTPNADKSLGISNEDYSGFDAVSIHQGLLDKLYELFNIKYNSTARERLTRDFYRAFVGDKQIISFPDSINEGLTHYFLPGMTIHSGRSKPSEYDMPQHLPFIPFSAIEHAVMDCKFSLIELLDSARYE